MRIVKSNSSKWINERNGKFDPFAWQDGYGAFSISKGHVDVVVGYIANQEEHHHKTTFQEEFRRLCDQCGVEYDERYVWD